MSVRAISYIWEDKSLTNRAELLVMLVIADHASNDEWEAFPSIETIARKPRLSQRGVQDVISTLKARFKLSVNYGEGRNGTNVYRIIKGGGAVPAPRKLPSEKSSAICTQTIRNHQEPSGTIKKDNKRAFTKPTMDELVAYGQQVGFTQDQCERFMDYYDSKGWMVGKSPMKDWKAAVRNWIRMKAERDGIQQTRTLTNSTDSMSPEDRERYQLNKAIHEGTFYDLPETEQRRLNVVARREGIHIPRRTNGQHVQA